MMGLRRLSQNVTVFLLTIACLMHKLEKSYKICYISDRLKRVEICWENIMKIVLAALNAKYVHSNLAVYDIEAYAKEQINKLENKEEFPEIVVREYTINHNLDAILRSIYQEKAAVVAFSCYIWNIHEILTISKELHKIAPETKIWLGGPEVSYDSEKLLLEHNYIEGIMQGEGEATFFELVKVWNYKEKNMSDKAMDNDKYSKAVGSEVKDYQNVAGIIYRDRENRVHRNPARALLNLDNVPFIYNDLSRFENRILYYETSRGCPFSCSYCLSSIDKNVRFRSLSLVEKELQFFLDNKVPQVKFIDRTFNCKKEHSLAIWNYITENDNGITNFHFEVAADLIGEEEVALFAKMRLGLIQLEIGLQSTNAATIKEIRRVMDIEKLKKTLLIIRSFGNIHQHLDLIAGLPYEDLDTFIKSFNEAYEMKPNQLQLGFLKVLKGSFMGEQVSEYELKYQDFQPYEVLSTKWISFDELLILKNVEEMVEVYYNSDQFSHVLSYVISFFESPYKFYETIGSYYEEKDLFGIGFKREARYEVLREFCIERLGKSDEFELKVLDNLLSYDYYLRENAKSRPSWAKEEPIEKSAYHNFFKSGGNDEISLEQEGYDSKEAARMMHIEPVVREAARYIINDLIKEEYEIDLNNVMKSNDHTMYCLFDYEQRNPLSKSAKVHFLSKL